MSKIAPEYVENAVSVTLRRHGVFSAHPDQVRVASRKKKIELARDIASAYEGFLPGASPGADEYAKIIATPAYWDALPKNVLSIVWADIYPERS